MKRKNALLGLIVVALTSTANAATLTWDANAATAPNPYDGAGTWNLTGLNFWNGTALVAWNNTTNAADTAAFGTPVTLPLYGNAGVVGLNASTLNAGGIEVNPYVGVPGGKYNINNGTLAFGSNAATLRANPSWARPYLAINATLTGTGGLTIAGSGIIELGTGANTFTGGLNLSTGSTLTVDADARLGAASNPLQFTGSSSLLVRTTASFARNTSIAANATASIDVLNGVTATWGSGTTAISGPGHLEKSGLGALTLAGAHSYQGTTRVRQGTLTLDFANAASPATDILAPASRLVLAGGTLAANGKSSAATNAQSFNGTTLLPGASAMSLTLNTATTLTANLGTLTRSPGATLNLAPIAANTFYSTSNTNTNGILGGYATINGTDWASVSAGTLTSFSGYQTSADATTWSPADNVSLTGSPSTDPTNDTTIHSLRALATATVTLPTGKSLTLTSGGLLASGTSPLTITGGTLKGAPSADLAIHQHSTGTTTISSVIADNAGPVALTKSGAGTLVLTGTNTYSGSTYLNAGTLDAAGDAALGTGPSVISRAGTTLAFSGSTPSVSSKNFLFDLGSETYGAAGQGGAAGDPANFNVVVNNPAGVTLNGEFNVPAGSVLKKGPGALTLTHPAGGKLGRLNGGISTVVEEGALVLNGGPNALWQAGLAEITVGIGSNATAAASRAASLTLTSGSVVTGGWTSIGRGNGTTGLESKITMNNGSWDTGSLGLGFANGVTGYNAKPRLEMSNDALMDVRDVLNCGESAGSDATITLTGNATMRVRNRIAIGQAGGARGTIDLSGNSTLSSLTSYLAMGVGGTATVTVRDNATFSCATDFNVGDTDSSNATLNILGGTVRGLTFFVGKGSNATTTLNTWGVVNQSGGSFAPTAPGNDWKVGGNLANDAEAYGAYNISGGSFDVSGHNFQVGVYGRGVLDISGTATVTSNAGWPVIGRYSGSFGVMNLSSGSFTQSAAGNGLIIGEAGNGTLNFSGGNLNITGGIGLRISNAATGIGIANLNGGTLTTTAVSYANGGTGRVYLNGTLVKAGPTSATAFLGGLTSAWVGPGGARIDSNGRDITVSQALTAPTGNGLSALTLGTPGAGYVSQPVVSITGGGGSGASAIATVANGTVTGFIITNPGSGYTGVPTVTLIGGGATTTATATAALAPVPADAGLTKTGAGTLTLSGPNSYKGGTTVTAGTLALGANETLPDTGNLTLQDASLNVGGFSDTIGALTLTNGSITGTGALTATSFAITVPSGASTVSAALGGAGADLTKNGAGELVLTGLNSYTGTTRVNAGTLSLGATGALDFASSLTATNATLDLRSGSGLRAQTLANLTLDNSTVVFGLTGSSTDALQVTGTTALTGTNRIKISGSVAPGTYTLLSAASPLTGTLTLDTSEMATGFTSYSGAISGNQYRLTATGNTTPVDAWWKGDVSNLWSDASQAASANSNWATNAGGAIDTRQLPGGMTHVHMVASGATNTATRLGTHFAIQSLTFETGTASITGETRELTILGTNLNGYPLEVLPGASASVDAVMQFNGTVQVRPGASLTFAGGSLGDPTAEMIVDGTLAVEADLTRGVLTGTGTVTRNTAGSSTLTIGDALPQTFSGNIQNSAGTLSLTKDGSGSLLLSGTNSTFNGTLRIAAGSLTVDNPGAIANPGAMVMQSGTTFANAAGNLTITCPLTLALGTGTAAGVTQPGLGGGTGNYLLDLGSGNTVLAGWVSNTGGSVAKRGSGMLAITAPGTHTLAASGGIALAIQEGALVLDGGPTASYAVNTGTMTVGDNTPLPTSFTLASGDLTVASYLVVGRGNGAIGVEATANLNGGSLTVPNLYTGFANGIAGYNSRPVIHVNGTTVNTGAVRIGESAGSTSALNLNSGAFTATGLVQIGHNGIGTAVNQMAVSLNSLQLGSAANGTGIFINNGTVTLTSAASITHMPIGNGAGAYGYFRNNPGATLNAAEVGVGGSAGTDNAGVLDLAGGTVNVATWLTPNRGGTGQCCLLHIAGGTLVTPNSGQAGANWSTNQFAHIDVSNGGTLAGAGPLSTLNLNQSSSADNTGILTLGTGGSVQLTSLRMAATAGKSVVNFNGGTLKATADAPALLDASLTHALIHANGAVIDTNGFDATAAEPLLAPDNNGLASISLTSPGDGYRGRPVVRISGDGSGASAVADFDPATGRVTGIRITSPGSGYTLPPTVTLVGGGATSPATIGSVTLAPAPTSGGLTKEGNGNLTLNALNTYTGHTTVNAGTLTLADNAQLKFVPKANGITNSVRGSGTATFHGDFLIDTSAADPTSGNQWTLVNAATLTESFSDTFTVIGFTENANVWTKTDGEKTWTFSEATGVLSLSSGAAYDQWAAAKGLTKGVNDGKSQDPDNDGTTNLGEFALDGNPLSAASSGKVRTKIASVGGVNVLTLTLPVRNGAVFSNDPLTGEEVSTPTDGIVYRIQGADKLSLWNSDVSEVTGPDAAAIQTGLPAPLSDGWTYRTFRAPGPVTAKPTDFLRAKISE